MPDPVLEHDVPKGDGGLIIPLDEDTHPSRASFSLDGGSIALVGQGKSRITVFDAVSGHVQSVLPYEDFPESITYTPTGDLLIVGRLSERNAPREAYVRLIDAKDGHVKSSPMRGIQVGALVALSPDGRWLAATDPDAVIVWDLASDREAASLMHRRAGSNSLLVFAPDGKTLAIADGVGRDGLFVLWDRTSGRTRPLPLPESVREQDSSRGAASFAFSTDGTRLAGAFEGTAQYTLIITVVLWDTVSGAELAHSAEEKGPGWDMRGYRLRFSPDDRWLLSAYSRRITRHDPRTGAVVAFRDPPYGNLGGPTHVLDFSRDCERFATVDYSPYEGTRFRNEGARFRSFVWEIRPLFDVKSR